MQADRVEGDFQQEAIVLDYVATRNGEGYAVSSQDVAHDLGILEAVAAALLTKLYQQGFLRREVEWGTYYYQLSEEAWERLSWFEEEGYL